MALSDMLQDGAELLGDFAQTGMEIMDDLAPLFAAWRVVAAGIRFIDSLSSSNAPPLETQRQQITALEKRKQELTAQAADSDSAVFDTLWQTAEGYLDEIKTMRHELFLHQGEVEELALAIRQSAAYQKRGKGFEQAVLIEVQSACRLARSTYQKLYDLELEWERTLQTLQTVIAQAEKFEERCTVFPVGIQTSEGREEIELDIDYWTDGGLSALREAPPVIGQDIPLEELRALVHREQERLAAMQALPQAALDAFCAAQIRREICEIAQDTLARRGWRLSGYGYREEKQRAQLQMGNAAQDVLHLTVSRSGDCQLRARFYGVGNTDVQQRLVALLQDALRGNGFSVENARVEDI